ncbi:hypothetical protein SDC9_207853 [bioreactor metagenome]|uniref:Uncharacterized protein n=1 Tax=bioreactor metagenome TaxID=1076179 RepID=A0A645J8Z2_9ZZZZ
MHLLQHGKVNKNVEPEHPKSAVYAVGYLAVWRYLIGGRRRDCRWKSALVRAGRNIPENSAFDAGQDVILFDESPSRLPLPVC